ncbi:MAG: DUF1398 domain-containing protein [Hyphomicrobiaceae bacterium]
MNASQKAAARSAIAGAYDGSMDFPSIIVALSDAGFEGYAVDYRRAAATYYLPSGSSFELSLPADEGYVAANFSGASIKEAIREAQRNGTGYTYKGFCRKVMAAGCAGYMVSFPGRRVLYYGRTAEVHVEHFPD